MSRSNSATTYPAGECFVALVADKRSRDKVGVVVALEVHVEQLFLPECLLALAAGKWLLPSVRALVHDHMALLRDRKEWLTLPCTQTPQLMLLFHTYLSAAVVALVAFETLLVLVGLLVLDERVSLMEHGVAVAALLSRLDERMLFPQVDACDGKQDSRDLMLGSRLA